MSTKVFDVVRAVRELVCDPRRQQRLMQDKAGWLHVCVCMDVISDAEQAIRGYLAQTTTDHDILYLTTYGVLQAFVTQQDAVAHLAAALGHPIGGWGTRKMDWTKHPDLLGARDVRNRAAGHPSKTWPIGSAPEEYHAVIQGTLQAGHFEMHSFSATSDRRTQVDVTGLAADQQARVGDLLERLRDALVEEDRQHKVAFQDERLSDLFAGIDYALEKITGALGGWEVDAMAQGGLDVLTGTLDTFRDALAARGLSVDSVNFIYSELDFPLERIRQVLDAGGSDDERKNAYYLAKYVRAQLDELGTIAVEIDDKYRPTVEAT
jgi:hypothetical protein